MTRSLKKALFFGGKIENKEAKSKKGGKTTFSANSNSKKTLSQKPTKREGAGPALYREVFVCSIHMQLKDEFVCFFKPAL